MSDTGYRVRLPSELEEPISFLKQYPAPLQREVLDLVISKLRTGKPLEKETEEEFAFRVRQGLNADKNRRIEGRELQLAKQKAKMLLEANEELEGRLAAFITIADHEPRAAFGAASNGNRPGEADAQVIWSDWHLEERVEAATVNGLNEYSVEIAKSRIHNMVQNTVRLIDTQRSSVEIRTMSLFLIGDLITGYIHDELRENNEISPTQSILEVYDILHSALDYLKGTGGFDRIDVYCQAGNHGRVGKDKFIATAYKNSYEWMLFKILEGLYRGDSVINFFVPEGQIGYTKVYDKVIRYTHGDAIMYGGGIGGLYVPLHKAIFRWDAQIKADMTYMGHFHQFLQPAKNIVVNGSVIGLNPYAMRLGCAPEAPMQTLQLLDKRRGFTVRAPIFCD